MIQRAVAIEVKTDTPQPKPGDEIAVTLNLINAGAGHKIPTGDPDRHFTIEFSVEDGQKNVLDQQKSTMGRWILWQPAILELYDNRLLPLASREYSCLLYTSDAADERSSVSLGGRRILNKKKTS